MIFFIFALFFPRENKYGHADDSHELSRLIFSEKKKKFNIRLDCRLLQLLLGALKVNMESAFSFVIPGYSLEIIIEL